MTETNGARPEPGPDAGIDDIQADIEHTRKELGETVQALGANSMLRNAPKRRSRTPRSASSTRPIPCDTLQPITPSGPCRWSRSF